MRREEYIQNITPLPSGYRKLRYLESTGTQYIQLNFGNDIDKQYRVDFQVNRASSWIMGSVVSAGYVGDFGIATNTIRFSTSYVTGLNLSNARHIVEVDKSGYSIDGISTNWTTPVTSASSYYGNIRLFCANASSLTPYGIIYRFETYDYTTGNLTMQLIPALRIADSKPGLYDVVNNDFYTNAGSGEFLYS